MMNGRGGGYPNAIRREESVQSEMSRINPLEDPLSDVASMTPAHGEEIGDRKDTALGFSQSGNQE